MDREELSACSRCSTAVATVPSVTVGVARGPELTEVERRLLDLMAQGLTDDAVAKRLGVSVRTERRMVADLMKRLQASGRFDAGVKAARHNWI